MPDSPQLEPTPVDAVPPQPVADPADLAAQIEALRAKNAELIGERRKDRETRETLQARLAEIEAAQQQARQQQLVETGEYKTLWEQANETNAELRKQLAERDAQIEDMRSNYTREQVKAASIAQLSSAGAVAPDQLYHLLQDNLRTKDGQPVAVIGGVEVPITEYISNLKNPGSGYEHHFAATNRSGMGVASSARATAIPGQSNPWLKDSWNITQQLLILSENPDLARLLKAEASR